MKPFTLAVLVVLLASCGPKDLHKTLLEAKLEVAPGQGVYNKLNLERNVSFTLTATATGGDCDGWVSPGAQAAPIIIYDPKTPLPMAKVYADGKEDSSAGTLGWGPSQVIFFNRGSKPVKVLFKLTVLPTP